MVVPDEPDTEQLLERAGRGDLAAREQLLARHWKRLQQMIALRMDRRLAARLDPADVVQETMIKVWNGRDLAEQLQTPPSMWVLHAVPAAKATLEAGFTAVRDAGGTPAGVRMAIERGLFPGPRVKVGLPPGRPKENSAFMAAS